MLSAPVIDRLDEAIEVASAASEDEDLSFVLYRDWYCGAAHTDLSWVDDPWIESDLAGALSASDALARTFDGGWTVLDREVAESQLGPRPSPWAIPISKGSMCRWAEVCDVVAEPVGCRPAPGAAVAVAMAQIDLTSQPGWWLRSASDWTSPGDTIRLYWNARAAVAPTLVEALTSTLEDSSWALKAARYQREYWRDDAVVLYVDRACWSGVRRGLERVHEALGAQLVDRTPPMTRPLGRGLGLAHDLGSSSFGTQRCSLVAAALGRKPADPMDAVRSALEAAGVDVLRPWLRHRDEEDMPWG